VRLRRSAKRNGLAREWLLLIAILPSLTFLGHWEIDIPVSGTAWYVAFPGAHTADHHHDDGSGGGDHEEHDRHCHANFSSCADVPFTGASPFAVLAECVALLGAAGTLVLLAATAWQPGKLLDIIPEPRPPRFVLTIM
jgi:hypothetical protein